MGAESFLSIIAPRCSFFSFGNKTKASFADADVIAAINPFVFIAFAESDTALLIILEFALHDAYGNRFVAIAHKKQISNFSLLPIANSFGII